MNFLEEVKKLRSGEYLKKESLKEEWEDLNSYEDVVKFTKDCGGKWCCGLPREQRGEQFYDAYAKDGKHFVGDRERCILALKDKDGKISHKFDKDDVPVDESIKESLSMTDFNKLITLATECGFNNFGDLKKFIDDNKIEEKDIIKALESKCQKSVK